MSATELRSHISELARAGESFARIEAEMEATGLTEEQQSALWLWAWTLREVAKQR